MFCSHAASAASAGARHVTVVDVDVATGNVHVLGPDRDRSASPGSTLKPIVLWAALRTGLITAQTRVDCSGELRIGGRNLACSHPASLRVLDGEEALAYSCNTYFARLAQEMSAPQLTSLFESFGIHAHASGYSPEKRVLLALGLEGVTVTPMQLAHAYGVLARVETNAPQPDVLRKGLLGSVTYGMAHAAETAGLVVGGKTGTAHDPAPTVQHGWFAGLVFSRQHQVTHVVIVYAPGGNGNDAALAARRYLMGRSW